MQQFYQNKSVFVTGGSGFLGKVVIEKLLRSCKVESIYVLIRSKKGKDIATRIEDIMNDVVSVDDFGFLSFIQKQVFIMFAENSIS